MEDNNITGFLYEFQKDPLSYIRTYSYDEFLIFFDGYLLCEYRMNPSAKYFTNDFKKSTLMYSDGPPRWC